MVVAVRELVTAMLLPRAGLSVFWEEEQLSLDIGALQRQQQLVLVLRRWNPFVLFLYRRDAEETFFAAETAKKRRKSWRCWPVK